MAKKYILKIGLLKTLKNVLITFGVPAALYVLNNAADFIDPDVYLKISPAIAAISYFIKNWVENK